MRDFIKLRLNTALHAYLLTFNLSALVWRPYLVLHSAPRIQSLQDDLDAYPAMVQAWCPAQNCQ